VFVLGLVAFFIFMGVGESMEGAQRAAGTAYQDTGYTNELLMALIIAAYCGFCGLFLTRWLHLRLTSSWKVLLALNATLMLVALLALLVEPNRGAAYQTVGVLVVSLISSLGGAALASRKWSDETSTT
jgi:hypothetical protein